MMLRFKLIKENLLKKIKILDITLVVVFFIAAIIEMFVFKIKYEINFLLFIIYVFSTWGLAFHLSCTASVVSSLKDQRYLLGPVLIFFGTTVSAFFYFSTNGQNVFFVGLIAFIMFILRKFHVLRQSYGIKSLYFLNGKIDPSVKLRDQAIIWLIILFLLLTLNHSSVFKEMMLWNFRTTRLFIFAMVCALCIQGIFRKKSLLFSILDLKFLNVLLIPFSVFALAGSIVTHTIEYYYANIYVTKSGQMKRFLILGALFFLPVGLLTPNLYQEIMGGKSSLMVNTFYSLCMGITLSHYYLDWKVYKMKNKGQNQLIQI